MKAAIFVIVVLVNIFPLNCFGKIGPFCFQKRDEIDLIGVAHNEPITIEAVNYLLGDVDAVAFETITPDLDKNQRDRMFRRGELVLTRSNTERMARFFKVRPETISFVVFPLGGIAQYIYLGAVAKWRYPSSRNIKKIDGELRIEKTLLQGAQKRGLRLIELESTDQYAQVMFALEKNGKLNNLVSRALDCVEDLSCINRLMDVYSKSVKDNDDPQESYNDVKKFPSELSETLDERNNEMFENLVKEKESAKPIGKILVVVGAAHLGGDSGLMSSLLRKGYRRCN